METVVHPEREAKPQASLTEPEVRRPYPWALPKPYPSEAALKVAS